MPDQRNEAKIVDTTTIQQYSSTAGLKFLFVFGLGPEMREFKRRAGRPGIQLAVGPRDRDPISRERSCLQKENLVFKSDELRVGLRSSLGCAVFGFLRGQMTARSNQLVEGMGSRIGPRSRVVRDAEHRVTMGKRALQGNMLHHSHTWCMCTGAKFQTAWF